MQEPRVDLIIAVHTPSRPIERAVGSVLAHTRAPLRVTVVCHNTDPAGIRSRLQEFDGDERLRLLHLVDGIPSPSGPFNLGLSEATAPFMSIMGSDDELERGAIDSWLRLQHESGADFIIPRQAYAGGTNVQTPPARPFRRTKLDAVHDRLSYRSAPLGLISRARFGALRMMSGVNTGEDIGYVTALWFSGKPIAFDRRGPAYLVHDDAGDRVTLASKAVADDLAFLAPLLAEPRLSHFRPDERVSLIAKLLRINLFAVVHNRPTPTQWSAADRKALAEGTTLCLSWGHRAHEVLSRADRDMLDAMTDPSVPTTELLERADARRRYGRPNTLVPRKFTMLMHREAPVRMMVASAAVRAGW